MAKSFTDKSARKLDLTSIPAISNEAHDAVNAAFDAMSTWRTETVNNSEKNLEHVIEKMAAAARARVGLSKLLMPPVLRCKP